MSEAWFVAVEPDEEAKSLLAQMLARAFDHEWPLPGRLSPPENWHITVRFLGSLDEVTLDRLMAGLDETAPSGSVDYHLRPGPFTLALAGMGAFPRPDNATVLWVGVESEALADLAAAVEDLATAVGVNPEERPFRPHLTLSRIRPPLDVSDLTDVDWGRLRFDVDHLTLFRSEHRSGGVHYEPVERFSL